MTPQPKPSILSIKPYVPGKSSKKKDAKAIKLSSNENCYGPNPAAVEAYKAAISSLNRYPDGMATLLREAIGEAKGLDPERIICGAGSDELIGLLVHAYAGPGDEVLYSEHGFLMYKIYALAAGAIPVTAPEKNLTTDVDALLAKVTPKTKIVFVANPNNPTGSYISKKELERLRNGLPKHVILAIDAAYAEYAEVDSSPLEGERLSASDSAARSVGGKSFNTPPGALRAPAPPQGGGLDYSCGLELALSTENTVSLRTFSKIYGLPALRLGWMVAPANIIDIINRVRSPFNVSTPAQLAGVAAIKDKVWVETHRKNNAEQLAWLSKELVALGLKVYPSAGNFVLADCGDDKKAASIITQLASRDIYIRDVIPYGLPACIRITIGKPEENQALVQALREIF